MLPKLLKFSIEGLRIFENNYFEISFLNEKRATKEQIEDHTVEQLTNTVYKNNVVGIAGINASGKTTTLNLIKFILDTFVRGESLNHNAALVDVFKTEASLCVYLLYKGKIYQHTATIRKNDQLEFVEEKVLVKAVHKTDNSSKFLDFSSSVTLESGRMRTTLGDALSYLKKDDSMLPGVLYGQDKTPIAYLDSMDSNDINLLSFFPHFEADLFQYLDPSIETLKLLTDLNNNAKTPTQILFELKFYDHDPQIVSITDLNNYLSSGTIRGVSIFNMIKMALEQGCYFLVDEIELHFNKSIVKNIIQMFQSDVNVNNATLIFSTHYTELLDAVERKDAIKVLRKSNRQIKLESLNTLAKTVKKDRTDIKNSDLILSGIFDTAPIYEKYWRVNRAYKKNAERQGD